MYMRSENVAKNTGKCPSIAKIFAPKRKSGSPNPKEVAFKFVG